MPRRPIPTGPMVQSMPEQPDKHQTMLDTMHSALSSLRDKIQTPFARTGDKLLPPGVKESPSPVSKAARSHIERLHKAFKGAAKEEK